MTRKKSARRPRWFMVVMLLILGYFGTMIISQGIYLFHVRAEQHAASERLAAAQEENNHLQAEKTHLGELPYIEKLAREELGMTGAGELPYAPGKRSGGN
ncbi:FtsB family cell division protein [Selenomonas flueggei]|nr:septum formation initiator family protein [Selenomonas flueggei]